MDETEHQLAEIQKGLEEVENNEIATPEEVEAVFARWRTPIRARIATTLLVILVVGR